ncbi:MAG TPA: thioredoxin domain-containing protein, partial [Thermoanaerobaculia bacterium]|nr:thioredoxin domain-containing protein [Thermoanaerobaculia bacterium]
MLGVLALLGALSAMWALFLWSELVASRVGGIPFCAFGEEGCAELWDAGFAGAVHQATGLPVAGWGLVWGLAAFLLPLVALVGASEGRRSDPLDAAAAITGIAGVVGVIVLVGASAAAGLFCSSCALTYVLTIGYAGVAFLGLLSGDSRLSGRGLALAAGATLALYLALLYPGLRTPESVVRGGERALAATVATRAPGGEPSAPSASPPAALEGAETLLAELIANLPPSGRQALSDSLFIYSGSPRVAPREPRVLRGDPDAPVRITEFSDVLCSHCAELHRTLAYLETVLPPGSFSVDSRNFPLDGNCNRYLQAGGPESVRCLASRTRVCLDRTSHGEELAGALFARQAELTPQLVFELAAPFMAPAELQRCVASRETAQQLAADVDYAWFFEPDGTPLVLVNGRRGTSFGPFLYAMVLTGGSAEHPALTALPPP